MNKERIGVMLTLTDKFSPRGGIAVAIHDPVYEVTEYEFYSSRPVIEIIKQYLKAGLEIRSIAFYDLRVTTGREDKLLADALSQAGIEKIPVFYSAHGKQPFADATIPPNH